VALPGRLPRPRAAGAKVLLAAASAATTAGTPGVAEWGTFNALLPAWGRAVAMEGGSEALWRRLDLLMTEEDPAHEAALQRLVGVLCEPPGEVTLRSAFANADDVTSAAIAACIPACHAGSLQLAAAAAATALHSLIERRRAFACAHPITGANYPALEPHSGETVRDGWGSPAHPVDTALHHKAKLRIFRRHPRLSMSRKEALADKEYRARGGAFYFPSPLDTFIRGLHRRTQDLHEDWSSEGRDTSNEETHQEAVAEMLLRLRWDDRNSAARAKLSLLVERIWNGLEGVDLSGIAPLSSALWLDDAGEIATASVLIAEGRETMDAAATFLADGTTAEKSADSDLKVALPFSGCSADGTTAEKFADSDLKVASPISGCLVAAMDPTPAEPSCPLVAVEPAQEVRIANDGVSYSRESFLEHYGAERGEEMWEYATPIVAMEDISAGEGFAAAPPYGAGQGFAAAPPSVTESRWGTPIMDDGLQSSFQGLDEDLRHRIEAFVAAANPGSRLNLPRRLRPIQRKALHVWAALNAPGVEHKSFGWRNQRRLRLWVWAGEKASDLSRAPAVKEEVEFADWVQEEEEEWEEEEDVDYHPNEDSEEDSD